MNDDAVLLRRYAEEGAEDAFTELVNRHVDLVFGAAMRRTGGDTHLAADVAQQVFIKLAREARKLSRHTVLAAWLHTATRNAALNLMISEQRRRTRENVALTLEPQSAATEPEWERVRPVLDAAIDELPEDDRAAIALRFLQRRTFTAVGAALQISEDAARMRTDRALEKLRVALSKRGITSPAAALGVIMGSHSAFPAPAGMGALLATKSLAAVTAGSGLLVFSSIMNTPTLITAAATALLAFGAGSYFGFSQSLETPLPPLEMPQHSHLIGALRKDNLALKAEVARLNADVSRLNTAAQAPAPRAPATPQVKSFIEVSNIQKATLNNLRQIAAARDQFHLENGRPPVSVDELVGETKYIRRLIPVEGENYAGLSMLPNQPLVVVSSSGLTTSFTPTPPAPVNPVSQRVHELQRKNAAARAKAIEAYRAAHGGPPTRAEALVPYFATPQEGADFVELLEAQKAAHGN